MWGGVGMWEGYEGEGGGDTLRGLKGQRDMGGCGVMGGGTEGMWGD